MGYSINLNGESIIIRKAIIDFFRNLSRALRGSLFDRKLNPSLVVDQVSGGISPRTSSFICWADGSSDKFREIELCKLISCECLTLQSVFRHFDGSVVAAFQYR